MEELCLLCGKLVLLEDMKRHMDRVHENSKNVKCSDCDLIFASDKKMMNHRRIHNVKVFKCDEHTEQAHHRVRVFCHTHQYQTSNRQLGTPNQGKKQHSMIVHLNSNNL